METVYLEEPARKTLLTEVAAVRGQAVLLPKSIYHAPRPQYRHAQPSDKGHLLVGGHKLKIERVAWRDGDLLHFVAGPAPRQGEKVLAHLDWPRRHLLMRAHAAMHVLEGVVLGGRLGEVVKPFEVLNGGQLKATLKLPPPSNKALAEILQRANARLAEKLPITARWMPRDAFAHRATPTAAGEAAPGEPVLRVVETGSVSCVACDAPQLADTREVGRVVATNVLERREGTRVVFRIEEAG